MTGTMTGAEHREYLASFERIKAALVSAQTEREQRRGMVTTPSGNEAGWIVFERETVWRAVNDDRALRGLDPVAPEALAQAESMACGYSDYTKKFALYAADIAWDLRP